MTVKTIYSLALVTAFFSGCASMERVEPATIEMPEVSEESGIDAAPEPMAKPAMETAVAAPEVAAPVTSADNTATYSSIFVLDNEFEPVGYIPQNEAYTITGPAEEQ